MHIYAEHVTEVSPLRTTYMLLKYSDELWMPLRCLNDAAKLTIQEILSEVDQFELLIICIQEVP
jgi:hypothetical protein